MINDSKENKDKTEKEIKELKEKVRKLDLLLVNRYSFFTPLQLHFFNQEKERYLAKIMQLEQEDQKENERG